MNDSPMHWKKSLYLVTCRMVVFTGVLNLIGNKMIYENHNKHIKINNVSVTHFNSIECASTVGLLLKQNSPLKNNSNGFIDWLYIVLHHFREYLTHTGTSAGCKIMAYVWLVRPLIRGLSYPPGSPLDNSIPEKCICTLYSIYT